MLHERGREAVEARPDGGVGGEEIAGARDGQRHVERLAGFLHEIAGPLQNGERRVAFIEMADFRLEPERAQQTPAADAEEHFLLAAAVPVRRRTARW